MTKHADTIHALLAAGAAEATAISAPGRAPLTYAALRAFLGRDRCRPCAAWVPAATTASPSCCPTVRRWQ